MSPSAVAERYPDVRVDVWAMEEPGKLHSYPDTLAGTIRQDEPASYLDAARAITASGADMVWIQHEFGIFGGRAGDLILSLIDRMTVPVAVAMHTVLADPDRDQRRVTLALVERCETIIVMAEAARRAADRTLRGRSRSGGRHPPWHSRPSLHRYRADEGAAGAGGSRRYPDFRAAVAGQGHRDDDRGDARGRAAQSAGALCRARRDASARHRLARRGLSRVAGGVGGRSWG